MKYRWPIILGGCVLIALFMWIFVFGVSLNQPGAFFNKGHNATWIGHKWVAADMSDREISDLVANLEAHQVDTVFMHVGPINEDGTIEPEVYKFALNFLNRARSFSKKINYQAWLGQVRSKIDLSDEKVRHNLTNQVMVLSEFVGFDGIHFDIEPVWDGDSDFIKLLEESRGAMAEMKKLSVALPELIPEVLIWYTKNLRDYTNYNSEVNYKNVAKYADQIVAMVYDTSLKKPWLYRWLVSEQTIRLSRLLDGRELFVALPAYDYFDDEFIDQEVAKNWFDPEVENVKNGLLGVIKGLNNSRSEEETFAGVAIYPYWQIDEEEWAIYDNFWLNK